MPKEKTRASESKAELWQTINDLRSEAARLTEIAEYGSPDTTVAGLVNTASTLLDAASALVELRKDSKSPPTKDDQ